MKKSRNINNQSLELLEKIWKLKPLFLITACSWIPCVGELDSPLSSKGYKVFAPAWPGRDKSVDELRKNHPDPELPKLKLKDVVEHFANFIQGLDESPPSSSLDGWIGCAVMLQRDLAVAGVAIDPAPPAGVFTTHSRFWRPLSGNQSVFAPSACDDVFWAVSLPFVNTLLPWTNNTPLMTLCCPESSVFQLHRLAPQEWLDSTNRIGPLLITAGEKDHIVPAVSEQCRIIKKYKGPFVTESRCFPGRITSSSVNAA